MDKIKEIKKFVIDQMKKAPFANMKYGSSHQRYESDYIVIDIEDGVVLFTMKKSNSDFKFGLSDIKLSKIRFNFLMIRVKKSANEFKERVRKESLSLKWDKFLDINKSLNRDRKIKEVLED
jgi:hypothetical protein